LIQLKAPHTSSTSASHRSIGTAQHLAGGSASLRLTENVTSPVYARASAERAKDIEGRKMSDRSAVEMLKAARLFEGLSKKEVGEVTRRSKEIEHAAGDEIIREGAKGVGFHLILTGRARVTRNGRKLRELGPGDSFGDISLIDGGPRTASVIAVTPMRLLSMMSWEFKPLLIEHPQMAYKLLLRVCGMLREAESRPPA
jgi:CRP/FNR family transcriptional regulator, cyclic AMP receptor protein